MKNRKHPIRDYPKECLRCGKINPPKRTYCSDECLFQTRAERKRKTILRKVKPNKKKKKAKTKLNKCKNCKELTPFTFCKISCRIDYININRLCRPCKALNCGRMFKPLSKYSFMCPNCKNKEK